MTHKHNSACWHFFWLKGGRWGLLFLLSVPDWISWSIPDHRLSFQPTNRGGKKTKPCDQLLKWSEVKSLSCVRLFATPWTVAYQAPPSMGFSRQEYWSGLPFPSSGDLPNPGIEPRFPALEADTLTSEPPGIRYHQKKSYNLSSLFIF